MALLDDLPNELIALFAPMLAPAALLSAALAYRPFHDVFQPELDTRMLANGADVLMSAASDPSRLATIQKLLSPPLSFDINAHFPQYTRTPLHNAAEAGNLEAAKLLLAAGAKTEISGWGFDTPFHIATRQQDIPMMTLLLDHGSPVDSSWGDYGPAQTPLHFASTEGNRAMVDLLLARGSNIEARGIWGNALGCAVHAQNVDLVRFFLERGATIGGEMPYEYFQFHGNSIPRSGPMLFHALRLPQGKYWLQMWTPENRWSPFPLAENTKGVIAVLLAGGADKDETLRFVESDLQEFATIAGYVRRMKGDWRMKGDYQPTEEERATMEAGKAEFLNIVSRILKEAEA